VSGPPGIGPVFLSLPPQTHLLQALRPGATLQATVQSTGESLALHVLPWPGDPGARAVESRKSDGTPAFRARLLLVQ